MIKEYLEYLKEVRGLSPCTIEAYGCDLRAWVGYAMPRGLRWSTITERDVDGWLTSMSQEGTSARTRNRRLSALRGLLGWASHKGLLSSNAARFCQSAKTADSLPQGLDLEGIDKYLTERPLTTKSNIVALIVALMVDSGLRIGEVLSLRWEDIDCRRQSIRVCGKGRKERLVLYGERVRSELGAWMPGASGRLLPEYDARTYRAMIEDDLFPYVGKMHPHQLRHTFATAMVNRGMPHQSLAMLMGHSKTETTEQYARVAMSTIQKQYNQARF